jgi:hypothetical protein
MRATNNQDIAKLRALSAQGCSLAAAARAVGMSNAITHYWNEREHIGLIANPGGAWRLGPHPAPDIIACWRLHQTMQRLKGLS